MHASAATPDSCWDYAAAEATQVPSRSRACLAHGSCLICARSIKAAGIRTAGRSCRSLKLGYPVHAGGEEAKVATVANATIGLTLALLGYELPANALCIVPAGPLRPVLIHSIRRISSMDVDVMRRLGCWKRRPHVSYS